MEQSNEQHIEPVQSSKNIWITVVVAIVTALIVGGGVYAWQKSNLKSTEQNLQQQISVLQSQISQLQQVRINQELPGTSQGQQSEPNPNNMEEETRSIKVYFSTLKDNEGFIDCGKTEGVTRLIPETKALAEAALNQLFLGPTEEERAEGLKEFWINKELSHNLKRVFIKNNTAYLDWKDFRQTIGNASTSCGSQIFFAPIDATLKQFSSITNIVHAIDGKPAVFSDWMQIGCARPIYCDDTPYK